MTVRDPKYRLCAVCGNRWNVSSLEPGGKKYICPKCERQMKKNQRSENHEEQHREVPQRNQEQ